MRQLRYESTICNLNPDEKLAVTLVVFFCIAT